MKNWWRLRVLLGILAVFLGSPFCRNASADSSGAESSFCGSGTGITQVAAETAALNAYGLELDAFTAQCDGNGFHLVFDVDDTDSFTCEESGFYSCEVCATWRCLADDEATPTPTATAEPTGVPTSEPTVEPTAIPTPEVTPAPTLEPTLFPSPELTPVPTPESTLEPTIVATVEPTPEEPPVTPAPESE